MIRAYNLCYGTLLALLLHASSCTDGNEPAASIDEMEDSHIPIQLTASIEQPVVTRAPFIGPVVGKTFSPNSEKIFGVTAFVGNSVPTSWAPNTRVNNASVNTDSKGAPYFDTLLYYPREQKFYFYAYSPMVHCEYNDGDANHHPTITYQLTGREDILWTKNETGIGMMTEATQTHPNFVFKHKLQRVVFSIKRTAQTSASTTLSEIRLLNQKTKATLNLITGDVTFEEDADNKSLSINYEYQPTTDPFQIPYDFMFEPGITKLDLVFVIDGTNYDVSVTLPDGNVGETRAGYQHRIDVTISRSTLSVGEPVLVDWTNCSIDETFIQ